jgi:hypothetical protein
MRNNWLSLICSLALILVWTACSDEAPNANAPGDDAAGKKSGKFDPLSVECVASSKSTITVKIVAGGTGAPAGFSLQWMTLDDYETYGWGNDEFVCKGSFSGNARDSRYKLASNGEVVLTIGDLYYDNGASTSCPEELECGTTYVFRTFAHATSSMFRSDFSQNYTCSTAACEGSCPHGFGHFKDGDNWPEDVVELDLGNITYTKEELLTILDTNPSEQPGPANALISLAHQLIAAKLNLLDGAISPQYVLDAIDDADDFIGDQNVLTDYVGANTTAGQDALAIKDILDSYNNGADCAE